MKVTIVDRSAMSRAWGTGLYQVVLRTVVIADTCSKCGGQRGDPVKRSFCEDGDWYTVDTWRNPCGHIDRYVDVLTEARAKSATGIAQ